MYSWRCFSKTGYTHQLAPIQTTKHLHLPKGFPTSPPSHGLAPGRPHPLSNTEKFHLLLRLISWNHTIHPPVCVCFHLTASCPICPHLRAQLWAAQSLNCSIPSFKRDTPHACKIYLLTVGGHLLPQVLFIGLILILGHHKAFLKA